LGKHQKLTVIFCLLSATSGLFGQAAKTTFTYAPLVGYFSGFVFIIFAFFMALKAFAVEKKR